YVFEQEMPFGQESDGRQVDDLGLAQEDAGNIAVQLLKQPDSPGPGTRRWRPGLVVGTSHSLLVGLERNHERAGKCHSWPADSQVPFIFVSSRWFCNRGGRKSANLTASAGEHEELEAGRHIRKCPAAGAATLS